MILVLSRYHVWMPGLVGQGHILMSTLTEVFHFLVGMGVHRRWDPQLQQYH